MKKLLIILYVISLFNFCKNNQHKNNSVLPDTAKTSVIKKALTKEVVITFNINKLTTTLKGPDSFFLKILQKPNDYYINSISYISDSVLSHFQLMTNTLKLDSSFQIEILRIASRQYDSQKEPDTIRIEKICCAEKLVSKFSCDCYLLDLNKDGDTDLIVKDPELSSDGNIIYNASFFNKLAKSFYWKSEFFDNMAFYGMDKSGKYVITYWRLGNGIYTEMKNAIIGEKLIPISQKKDTMVNNIHYIRVSNYINNYWKQIFWGNEKQYNKWEILYKF